MRVTDSIRTATRWSCCNAVAIALLAAACSQTTRYFVPSAGDERLTVEGGRDQLDELLKVECPRLMQEGKEVSKEARIMVDVSGAGAVLRSSIARSSGDERVDSMVGAVSAKLQFDPPSTGTSGVGELRMGYACTATSAVTTLRLMRGL